MKNADPNNKLFTSSMECNKNQKWNLRSRISDLLRKESSSDVEFLIGTPPQRYPCHKVILAAGSEVFESMFYGSFEQKYPVRVPDVTSKGFALMLQYLYSDTVDIQDESDAFEASYSAKKYMIGSLFDICESFLLDSLTLSPENVLVVHEESSFLGMRKLWDRCLRYVSRNARKVFHCRSHVRASKATFEDVLSLDLMLIASEREVVEALWLWGEQRCAEEGERCSVENVRRYTRVFLKHVRFFAMTMEELSDTLQNCQILDTSDELALLWNFALPRTKRPLAMPFDICTETKTRSISNSSKVQFPGQYRYDGNMTSFLIENYEMRADITVTGKPVTLIGAEIAFKPIPCYSCSDRSLEVDILADNTSSRVQSSSKSRLKPEEKQSGEEVRQLLLLDDYIVIEEQQVASLTVTVSGEGVRLMQCEEETLSYDLDKSKVRFKFEQSGKNIKLFMPIKELMIV